MVFDLAYYMNVTLLKWYSTEYFFYVRNLNLDQKVSKQRNWMIKKNKSL